MPPRNLLAARAVTENSEPCVPGPRPPGPSPPFQPGPRAGAPAAPRETPPGASPAGRRPGPAPAAALGPCPPSWAQAPLPAPACPRRPCPSRGHPRRAAPTWPASRPSRPAPPARAGPRHKGPGGVRCGRVGPRPRPRPPGPPRAPASGPLTHLRAAARCVAELLRRRGAGRRARAAAPSFRTTRAEAPARGRDRAAGGAHAPPAWLPPPALPRRPRRRPRVRPPRAAPLAGGVAASAARCRANRGRGAARPPESTLRAPQPRHERRPAAHWARAADGRARRPMTTGRGGAAAPRVPGSGSRCHRRGHRGPCDPAVPRPGAHPAGGRAGEQWMGPAPPAFPAQIRTLSALSELRDLGQLTDL